jgi:hypothetical protein
MSARSAARLAQIAGLALTLGGGAAAQAVEPAPAPAPKQPAAAAQQPPAKAVPGKAVPGKDVAAQPAADDELLEFLGGADGELDEDGDWLDFLASTDIRKLAGARK